MAYSQMTAYMYIVECRLNVKQPDKLQIMQYNWQLAPTCESLYDIVDINCDS